MMSHPVQISVPIGTSKKELVSINCCNSFIVNELDITLILGKNLDYYLSGIDTKTGA
jgi:hypothetical protein